MGLFIKPESGTCPLIRSTPSKTLRRLTKNFYEIIYSDTVNVRELYFFQNIKMMVFRHNKHSTRINCTINKFIVIII